MPLHFTTPSLCGLYRFLVSKWSFDIIYNQFLNIPLLLGLLFLEDAAESPLTLLSLPFLAVPLPALPEPAFRPLIVEEVAEGDPHLGMGGLLGAALFFALLLLLPAVAQQSPRARRWVVGLTAVGGMAMAAGGAIFMHHLYTFVPLRGAVVTDILGELLGLRVRIAYTEAERGRIFGHALHR